MVCKICLIRDADFEGSHVIPHFIIAPGISDGSTSRDLEQSFQIGHGGSDFYFGRSVLPETLENTLGRPVTNEEIENNTHHYIRDNIYCTQCESELSRFESLYNEEVAPALLQRLALSERQKNIAHYFWVSIILRCSVIEFTGFKLIVTLEQEVRGEINGILSPSQREIEEKCMLQPRVRNVFIGFMAEPVDAEDITRNMTLLHPGKVSPYLLVVSSYVIIFDYDDVNQLTNVLQEIGINSTVSYEPGTIIQYITAEERNLVIRYCAGLEAEQFVDDTLREYTEAFVLNQHCLPSQLQTQVFFSDLLDETVPVTVKFSRSRVVDIIRKHTEGHQ